MAHNLGVQTMKIGDRIKRDGQNGTITFIYPPSSSGVVLVEWKSCFQYYITNATALENISLEKPRWRKS